MHIAISTENTDSRRENLLHLLGATTFLIFFQAYMVAPLIPRLSLLFGVSAKVVGLAVPAYMIPYGISVLFFWIGITLDRPEADHVDIAAHVCRTDSNDGNSAKR